MIFIQTAILAQADAFKIIGKIHIETPYADQGDFNRWYYDSTFYETARLTKTFECLKLSYNSDTATVKAWLYKPVMAKEKLPITIFNHGGMGNYGNLSEANLVDFHKMAEAGLYCDCD